jgi:hypothetical protein
MEDYNLEEIRNSAMRYIESKRSSKSSSDIYKELRLAWESAQDSILYELFEKGRNE